mmetsp:Transcript_40095/g.107465  ORF Transcript_40095/g.107465 Transcript_40095/m.107465 type:complete len:231 (+) Transcript_40095:1769-2461(+)
MLHLRAPLPHELLAPAGPRVPPHARRADPGHVPRAPRARACQPRGPRHRLVPLPLPLGPHRRPRAPELAGDAGRLQGGAGLRRPRALERHHPQAAGLQVNDPPVPEERGRGADGARGHAADRQRGPPTVPGLPKQGPGAGGRDQRDPAGARDALHAQDELRRAHCPLLRLRRHGELVGAARAQPDALRVHPVRVGRLRRRRRRPPRRLRGVGVPGVLQGAARRGADEPLA